MNSFDSAFFSRCASICLITAGSSILAITLTAPPHSSQVVISILNTRLRRCAFMPSGAGHRGMLLHRRSLISVYLAFGALASFRRCHQYPQGIKARCLLFGANTPWKRVRLALGLGTRAVSRAMKSSVSKMTWVVPYPKHSLRSWGKLSR